MTDTQDKALKFAYFLLGISLPIAGYVFWSKIDRFGLGNKKARQDEARDIAVEDSFPASDPPASW